MHAWGELLEGLRALRGDLRRVITTVLGVAWGTFAVVGLGAFSTGLEESMATRAAGMGQGIVIVWPGQTTKPWQGVPEGRAIRLTAEEVRVLRRPILTPKKDETGGLPVRIVIDGALRRRDRRSVIGQGRAGLLRHRDHAELVGAAVHETLG